MPSLEEIEAPLAAPGSPFETHRETVMGVDMDVFVQRKANLREAFEEGTANFADLDYLVFEGGPRLTFSETRRAVASVAKALSEEYGVGKGDRVAILAANSPEWILTFWAATCLGAVSVAMNGWWAGDEIEFGIEDSSPAVLVADRKRIDRLEGADPGVPVVETDTEFARLWEYDLDADLPTVPIDEDDPVCILYTSGTTGRPKGVVHTHRNVLGLVGIQIYQGLRSLMMSPPSEEVTANMPPQRAQLVSSPLFHVSGLHTHVVTFLITGVKTVWTVGKYDPVRVMALIEDERVTGWSPMGSMGPRLVNHPDVGKYDLSTVVTCGSGGSPMAPAVQERLREVFPNAKNTLAIGYGLTEATGLSTLNFGEFFVERPDSVGPPLPTVQVEIHDPVGQALPEGEDGEIWIGGPMVMKEYWNRPDETAEVITEDRWLRTGDFGHMTDGFLYINSRARDLILRAGENVYPAEIEMRLDSHPAVHESAVVGVEHPELGQEVKAIVVPEGDADLDLDELRDWVAATLAYFKVPTHWEVRAEPLPRNASGKIMKPVLQGEEENPFVGED